MAICRRYAFSEFEADDIFQESFIRIFNKIDKYNPSNGGNFKAWTYRLTVNVALKHIKNQNKFNYQDISDIYDSSEVSVNLSDSLTIKELQGFIDKLPPGQKLIFNMFAIDGFSHKEIAEALNINESASRSQLTRARETLKKYHKELNDFELSSKKND